MLGVMMLWAHVCIVGYNRVHDDDPECANRSDCGLANQHNPMFLDSERRLIGEEQVDDKQLECPVPLMIEFMHVWVIHQKCGSLFNRACACHDISRRIVVCETKHIK